MSPLPSEEATPPVTKTCLVGCGATKRAPRGLEWRPRRGPESGRSCGRPRGSRLPMISARTCRGANSAACPAWCLRRPRRLGHVEQLLGVRHRGVGLLETGQHAGELLDPARVVEDVEARGGDASRRWTCARRRGGRRTPPPGAGGSPRGPGPTWPARRAGGRSRPRPCRRPRHRPRRRRRSGTGRVSARATSMASITRDSSPPEAPLVSGRGSEPVLAASTSSTSSTPEGP